MNWDYGRDTYSEIDVVNERMSMHAAQTERAIENLRQQVLAQQAQQQPMYSGGGATMAPHTIMKNNPGRSAELIAHTSKGTIVQSPWNSKQNFHVDGAKNAKEAYGQLLVKGFLTAADIPEEFLPDFFAKPNVTEYQPGVAAPESMYEPSANGHMCRKCDSWVQAGQQSCAYCGYGQPSEFQKSTSKYDPYAMMDPCKSCGELYYKYSEHSADEHEKLDKHGRCKVKREQWWKKFRALYWHRRGKQPELFTLNA